jgi:NitT/TauT family transport system substrate-binding protein
MKRPVRDCVAAAALLGFAASASCAESSEVRVARQYGIGYLQFMIMEEQKLVERHARALGGGDVRVSWAQISGGSSMNDALISGSLDFAAVGVPPMVVLWARTDGERSIRGVAALNSYPMYLNTTNPNVRSIKDFGANDRIAVPAVKVSAQAIALQMAAAKAFGESNYQKLDALTVSMSHPDAVTALLSRSAGVNSHFTNQPFSAKELKDPKIHTVVNSFQIYGGPATAVVAIGSGAFRKANPNLYKAFYAALQEATRFINADRPRAAELYLKLSKDTSVTRDEIVAMLSDPDFTYTVTPANVQETAVFMNKVGSIKRAPASWKDMFFPEAHELPGS